ncbi:MAG: hypothetical protein LBQ12_06430, partial [Deltaproteobacteria bacterium]|nr:hypothetical protein [Deltaproteobacteria bacterium]
DQLIPFAKKERDELRKPALKLPLPDVSEYDTVFFGSPVWFHELPAATAQLLDSLDFLGKPVAPFLTAGGGPGDSMETLRTVARNARILEGKVVTRYASRPAEDIDREVDFWLKELSLAPAPPADARTGVPPAEAPPDPAPGGSGASPAAPSGAPAASAPPSPAPDGS